MPSGTPIRMPGTKAARCLHAMSGRSIHIWRIETNRPMNVTSGATVDSGRTNAMSGVITTPDPKPAAPRTA